MDEHVRRTEVFILSILLFRVNGLGLYRVRYSTVAVCQLFNKPVIDSLIDFNS